MRIVRWLKLLFVIRRSVPEFFARSTGSEYGIGGFSKLLLLLRIVRNHFRIPTASHVFEHLAMAARILQVPVSLKGAIVESGCWKGGSTANLSLVTNLCGRQLHVFDSFAGLPTPGPLEGDYAQGQYCGTFQEVSANIRRYGCAEVCTFHAGFFSETLPQFREPLVFAFIDVDLTGSLNDCLDNLWPLLQPGCYLFSHEARDPRILAVFASRSHELIGLPLIPGASGPSSDLGYTAKAIN